MFLNCLAHSKHVIAFVSENSNSASAGSGVVAVDGSLEIAEGCEVGIWDIGRCATSVLDVPT